MKLRRFIPVLIIAAGLGAYHNSLQGPFIFDDRFSVEDNPTIRHLWPIGDALSPSAKSFVGGRPLVNVSLALNYAWGGLAVGGYHAFNLAVHVLAGLTLYGIVRRTLLQPGLRERFGASGEWVALAVAVLWTVHPLQTEAVTYISQRCESLMGLFYLLSLYGFIRGAESRRSVGWFSLSVAACYLGVASKEVMVTAPVTVLLYDRTFVSRSFREAWTRHWRLYLGLASSWLWLSYLMTGLNNRSVGYGLGITWWGYALTECRVVVQYLRLAVWPHPLILDYGKEYVPTGHLAAVAPYALILAVLAIGVLFALKRHPAMGFVGAWFFVILAPTSSVVPVVGSPMGEHRMYLPLAAVVTMVVVGAFAFGKRLFHKQQGIVLGCVAGGSVAVLLTFLTVQRNRDYASEVTIWQDTVENRPHNPRAHYNLGAALLQTGKPQNAISHLEEALRIKPDYAGAHNDLGLALTRLGRPQEGIEHYQQAIRIKPDFAEAHNSLGYALLQAGKVQEAIGHYEQALRLKPDFAEAHNNLANALLHVGKVQDAVGHYEQAIRIKPDFAVAHNDLAWLLATHAPTQGGDAIRAVGLAQRACELTGDRRAGYLDTLAAAYAAAGRFNEAIVAAQKAVDLARAAGQPKLAGEYETRLELYRSGCAYHESVVVTTTNAP